MIAYELRDVGVYVYDTESGYDSGHQVRPTSPEWGDYLRWSAIPGNMPVPDSRPVAAPELAAVIDTKIAQIEAIASDQRRKITDRASPQEMAAWTLKLNEANAWMASQNDADAPMLTLEAQARGTTTQDIVNRVLANARQYQQAEGMIAGASGKHKDAVRALTIVEDVVAYDVTAGWPLRT